jgi:hypothetical protein
VGKEIKEDEKYNYFFFLIPFLNNGKKHAYYLVGHTKE